MNEKLLDRLHSTLGQGDWFWEWVELNQQDEELLPEWFRRATAEELLVFWRVYFDEVLGQLIPEYEGFFLEDSGGFHLSEDDMADFNNWVIVQGKALWSAMAAEAKLREQSPKSYDESRLAGLFEIYDRSRKAHGEGQDLLSSEWNGLKWQARWGYFPGDTADFIYEERFGETLWEQL